MHDAGEFDPHGTIGPGHTPGIRQFGFYALASAMSLVWLTGCGSASPERGPAEPSAPRPTAAQGQPLATGTDDMNDDQILFYAEDILTESCVRSHGYSYTAQRPIPSMRMPPLRVLVDDLDSARTKGYGASTPARALAARRANPNQRYLESLPPARQGMFRTVLYGAKDDLSVTFSDGTTVSRSSSGCDAHALHVLYGDLADWFTTDTRASAAKRQVTKAVMTDPQFLSAQTKWAECMKGMGHPFSTPAAVRQSLARDEVSSPDAPPSAGETALATAEATCAKKSGLAAIIIELRATGTDDLGPADRADVEKQQHLRDAAIARARQLIADRR